MSACVAAIPRSRDEEPRRPLGGQGVAEEHGRPGPRPGAPAGLPREVPDGPDGQDPGQARRRRRKPGRVRVRRPAGRAARQVRGRGEYGQLVPHGTKDQARPRAARARPRGPDPAACGRPVGNLRRGEEGLPRGQGAESQSRVVDLERCYQEFEEPGAARQHAAAAALRERRAATSSCARTRAARACGCSPRSCCSWRRRGLAASSA